MPLSSSLVPVDDGGRETKEHGTVLFPAAAYSTTMHYSIPWHWHTYMEAGILHKGSVRLLTEGHVFIIHEGEGFFLNADALHAFRRNGKEACEMHSVVFAPRIVAGSMERDTEKVGHTRDIEWFTVLGRINGDYSVSASIDNKHWYTVGSVKQNSREMKSKMSSQYVQTVFIKFSGKHAYNSTGYNFYIGIFKQ